MRLSGSRLATAAICEGVQGQLKSTRRQIPPAVNLVPATWKKLRDRHAQGDRYDCADAAAIEESPDHASARGDFEQMLGDLGQASQAWH
jgi:hypothetical protein